MKEIQSTSYQKHAEIAQLVEHNLAKVGVASSSLVFRSKPKRLYTLQFRALNVKYKHTGEVAELVDALL